MNIRSEEQILDDMRIEGESPPVVTDAIPNPEPSNGKDKGNGRVEGLFPGAEKFEFSYYDAPATNTKPRGKITLAMMLEMIRDGDFKTKIDEIRSTKNESVQQELKKTILPYVNITGEFETRGNEKILRHSGLLCLDLDYLKKTWNTPEGLKKDFASDPYIYAAFTSPRNDGIKIILQVPLIDKPPLEIDGVHKQYFDMAEKYVWAKYHLNVDKATRDVARATFYSYDPDLYFNETAETFTGGEVLGDDYEAPPANNKDDGISIIGAGDRHGALASYSGKLSWAGMKGEMLYRAVKEFYETRCEKGPGIRQIEDKELRDIAKFDTKYKNAERYEEEREKEEAAIEAAMDALDPADEKEAETFSLNESYASRLFEVKYRGKVKHCEKWARKPAWLVWDGKRYKLDEKNSILNKAKTIQRDVKKRVRAGWSEKIRRLWLGYANRMGNKIPMKSFLELAASEESIAVLRWEMNTNPMLVNCLNGTLDLSTGELKPHNPADLITQLAPVNYIPDATCPTFLKFMSDVMCGKRDAVDFVQMALGYSISGENCSQAYFINHGESAQNGKSTFMAVLKGVLGSDYFMTQPRNFLLKRRQAGSGPEPELACLVDCRVGYVGEPEKEIELNEALLKQISGGEDITARNIYDDNKENRVTTKIWLCVNHPPKMDVTDEGARRRVCLIPWLWKVPKEKKRAHYEKILLKEKEGIFAWMVEGAKKWVAAGMLLEPPKTISDATELYLKSINGISNFKDTVFITDVNSKIQSTEAWSAWFTWATQNKEYVMNQEQFKAKLKVLGVEWHRDKKASWYMGVRFSSTGLELLEQAGLAKAAKKGK